jgi:hypothetical protein
MSQGTNEIMIRNFVKICVETGNVDVVGRVYRSTALAEVRVAGDSDRQTDRKLCGNYTHMGVALHQQP